LVVRGLRAISPSFKREFRRGRGRVACRRRWEWGEREKGGSAVDARRSELGSQLYKMIGDQGPFDFWVTSRPEKKKDNRHVDVAQM